MTTRTAAAWDRIRAADPMAMVDVSGASEHPAAQELLRQITADVPAQPVLDEDVFTVLDIDPGRVLAPRRRGLTAGLATAAVVLAVVGTVVVVRQHRGTEAVSPNQQTTAAVSPTTPTTAAMSPRGQITAAGYAQALLAELPLPTGAKRVDRPPIPELKQSPATGNGIIDARVAWWTVPGSFAAAVAHLGQAGTLPAHWKINVSSTGGAGSRSSGGVIEVRDPAARFVSSVNVTIAAHGTTVGMAALVDTYANPVRTPAQVIPASVDSATFTVYKQGGQSGSSQSSIAISGSRVQALASEINATPTFVMLVQVPCPAPAGSVSVTFRGGSGRWSLNMNAGSFLCNAPSLTGTSGKDILLTPSTALLTDVLAAAGLPSNYFLRR